MIILILKRLLVFGFGLFLAWLTIFAIFPLLENWAPLAIAILITYCFIAYAGLPALHRFSQLLNKPTHVPTRTHAADGWAVDPINLVILADNEESFIKTMKRAGWQTADKRTIKSGFKMAWASAFNKPYPNAPFSNAYVFGRKQDVGFQIQPQNSPRHRHHVRFWRMGSTILEDEHEHQGFWRKVLKRFLSKKKQIWIGAAIFDKGIGLDKRTLQLSHSVHSDTSEERDFLVNTLERIKALNDCVKVKAGQPLHTSHQGFGEVIIADGYVTLCELKSIKKRS